MRRRRGENDDHEIVLHFSKSPFPCARFFKKISLRFATIPPPFKRHLSGGQHRKESFFRVEERSEWGEVGGERMRGMKEGVQSIWEVTVCN